MQSKKRSIMKTITAVSIVVFLFTVTFANAEWIKLGVNSAICQAQLYDPNTIKRSGEYMVVWSKCAKPSGAKSNLREFTALHEIACKEGKQRILQLQDVPLDASKPVSTKTDTGKWFYLAPGTVGEALKNKACK
jgi:hypothetical protein